VKLEIRGIGWITPSGLGTGRAGEVFRLGRGKLPVLRSRLFLETSHKRFGRFDLYAKAGFGAIALALRGAGLDRWDQKRAIGLVVSTSRGCLETDLAYFKTAAFHGGAMASPNLFAYTLPNCMLGEASIQFGLTGPSFVMDDPGDGHLNGIHAALDLLHWGLCETIVAGWCDVDSEVPDVDSEGPCGAVFSVLTRGPDSAPWLWDRGQLKYRTRPVNDIGQLVHAVLENTGQDE
jgi:3-oxoacyl-[acyl-carrier-protein] synthase II